MSTTGTALTFSIGAILGAGWVNAFSKATKDSSSLADKTFTAFSKAKTAVSSAEKELISFQKAIGNKTPTETQATILSKLNKELEKTKNRLNQATQSVSAWMSTATATGKFKLQEHANTTAESFSKLKTQIASVSTLFSGLFFDSVANSAKQIDLLGRSAENLGVSVETLQRLQFAGTKAGITSEKLTDYLTEMNKRISEAAAGSGEAGKVLEELGLSAQALNSADAVRKFELIAGAMSKVKNSADQARYADKLFGGEAVKTVPALVRRGWTQIAADMDAANGHIIKNEKATEISRAYVAAIERISASFTTLKQEAALTLMPSLEQIANGISVAISKCDWLAPTVAYATAALVGLKTITLATTTVITAKSAAMTAYTAVSNLLHSSVVMTTLAFVKQKAAILANAAVAGILKVPTLAVAAAMGIWKGVTIAMTAAQWALNAALTANPIGLVVAAIVAAVAAIAGLAYLIYDNWEPISEFFSGLWENLKTGFFSVVDWVKSGFTAAWNWLKSSAIFKAITEIIEWFSDLGGDDVPVPAPASVPISGTELESMTRAAVSNSNSVRTDARTFNTNANISIVQQPGEDSDALAQRVSARLADSYGNFAAATI